MSRRGGPPVEETFTADDLLAKMKGPGSVTLSRGEKVLCAALLHRLRGYQREDENPSPWFRGFAESQERLNPDDEELLHDNLWDLYQTSDADASDEQVVIRIGSQVSADTLRQAAQGLRLKAEELDPTTGNGRG